MKSKRERFKTVAANRVQRVLFDLDSLSKCSNRNNYEYNDEDVRKMIGAIKKKIRNVEDLFRSKLDNTERTFKF